MTDELLDTVEEANRDALQGNGAPTNGEMVHWMEKKPIRVGPAGISAAALGGFAFGVAATLGVLAVCGWIGPERDLPDMRR
ncbi:MAG: hypothetical protein JSS35_05980 [Proteobacteria bacterium]|nr:hypothetical protein [Pseudomonadota bacterium]